MAALGSLLVSLAVDTARFQSDLGKAAQKAAAFAKDMGKVGAAVGGMMAAAGGAMAVMVKQAIDAADANAKLAQAAGVSVETLNTLGYAASLAGSSTEDMGKSLGKLGKQISDAASGTGEAVGAFNAMGISVKDANGQLKSSEQVFREVAEKFASYEDGAGKSALAAKIFGEEGLKLIPLLNSGAEGLAAMEAEARGLGITMDTSAAKAAEAFNDNLSRLIAVKDGLVNKIAQELLPTLSSLSDRFIESAKNSGALEQAARAAAAGVRMLMSVGAIVVGVFKTVGEALGGVAGALVALFSGRFSEAFNIGKSVALDFVGNLRSTAANVSAIWDHTSAKVEQSAPANGARLAAPLLHGNAQAAKAAKALKSEVDKVQEAIARVTATVERDVATLGMSDRQIKLFDLRAMGGSPEQLSYVDGLLQRVDDWQRMQDTTAAAQQRANDLQAEAARYYEATRTPLEKLTHELARQEELLESLGPAYQDTYDRAVLAAHQAADQVEQVAKGAEKGKSLAEELGLSFTSAFEDAIVGGKGLGSILQGLEQDIIRILTRKMVTEPLGNALTGMLGAGTGGGIGSFLGGIFGGKAGGGPVSPGRAYLVGEHGPEVIVPQTASTVVPNGGQSINVVNNFTISGPTDRRTQDQIASAAAAGAQRALARNY